MKTKSANANSGPHDFPRRNGSGLERCPGYGRERNLSSRTHTHTHTISLSFSFSFIHSPSPSIFRSERGSVGASLIIGLNVASADSDESSGFECSLQYVTVIVAGQLTN